MEEARGASKKMPRVGSEMKQNFVVLIHYIMLPGSLFIFRQ